MPSPRKFASSSCPAFLFATALAVLWLPGTSTAQTDQAPVVTAPAVVNIPEGSNRTFTVTASDPDGDPIVSLTASSLPAGATFTSNATHTSGTFGWTPNFTQAGSYTVTFSAANALVGSASTNVTVCNGCARAPVVTAPASVTGIPNTLITFTVTAADPDADAITSLTASPLPALATFTTNASFTSGTFSWSPTNAQTGTFNVTFTASNDLVGSSTTQITVFSGGGDRQPVVTAPATVSGVENALINFSVTASDPDGEAITSLLASGSAMAGGATFTSSAFRTSGTFSWTPTFTQAGSYSVTFTATNALSGSATTAITVANVDRAPVVAAPATVNIPEGSPGSFTVTASDPDGDAITSLTAAGTAITAGGAFAVNATNTAGTFSWTPTFSQAGSYSATFTASNALSRSATTMILVCNGCGRAPVVTAPATAVARIGSPLTFTVSATDPDGDVITSLTASGTAMTAGATFTANASFTSGTFNWTPGFTQAGTYRATFTASNVVSGSANTDITVCDCDRAPVVAAPATVSGAMNLPLTFTVSAADPDGDAIVSLTAAPLPGGAAFASNAAHTSGTFDWTPTNAQTGVFNVTFTAANALSGSATTTIVTISSDRAPVVAAPSSVFARTGEITTFTVSASDPDGDLITALTASGSAIDAGGTFTAGASNTTGTFTWTPPDVSGSFGVTFRATNALQGTATTLIQVTTPPSARAFTVGSNKTIRLNSGKPRWCAFVEPMGESFSIMNIDLASIRLRYPISGAAEIPAEVSKSVVVGDVDKNNVADVEFCFAKENLRTLFSGLHGKTTVTVAITGSLMTGGSFEATLEVDVIAGGGSLAASITPNPLNPTGTISFSTPAAGRARVYIFDASGRLVRTLAETQLQAGRHDLPLDVRDGGGRRPPSGVYFYKVEVAGEVATGRFVVAR